MTDRITLDTPLKFTAPGGVAYAERGSWHLPQNNQPGEWMRDYKTTPILCERGYHWCDARHAIHHLHAECWLIEPRADPAHHGAAARTARRRLRRVETWTDRTARLFAADCAEAVVHLCGDDPRPRAAIDVARRYARGQASTYDLDAARHVAWEAARDAAWTAARHVAWDAQTQLLLRYLNGETGHE